MSIKEIVECDNCRQQAEIERHSYAEKPPIPVDWIVLFAYGHQVGHLYFCSPSCAIKHLQEIEDSSLMRKVSER